MSFIAKEDLYLSIVPEELEEITRGDDALVLNAISQAQRLLRDYLFDSYDVDVILAKTGEDRDQLLVRFVADIAVWYLCGSMQAGIDVSQQRQRYKDAIEWLEMARDSKIYPDLPRKEATAEVKGFSTSRTKRNNYY